MNDKSNAAESGRANGKDGAASSGASAPKFAPERKLYTVKGPSAVVTGGQILAPGSKLRLTEEEAASLGDALILGELPPADVIAERKDGKYEVAPDRNLWSEGKMQGPGYTLTLGADEARSLGDAVRPVVK